MSRVLLVCPEPLGHGQPAGIGIRFIEMARILRIDGHSVTVLSPDAGGVEGCHTGFTNPDTFQAASRASDVAVVQGHAANAFFLHTSGLPAVVDLYDPFIVENLHYYAGRGGEVFRHDHFTLINALLRGDYFLCASEAQRQFYLGLLLACGRVNPALFENDPELATLIGIAPFGVHSKRPYRERNLKTPAILFGGIYDWYDPVKAIEAMAIAQHSLPGATLTFTHHPNPELTPQGKLAAAMRHTERKGYGFVRFEPWTPYAERADLFERFSLALLTFPRSIETDLSMRTRVYDYLWCGLPIVTSSAPGTDDILRRYGAGVVIPSESDHESVFAREIAALLGNRDRYAQVAAGTAQFVEEHQWTKTLEPLRAFCSRPRIEKTKELFASRPAVQERTATFMERLWRKLR